MRVPRRAVWLVAAVVVAGSAAIVAAQQRWIDPAYPYTICETCHPAETGFKPIDLLAAVPPEVPPDRPFNVTLAIVNPWDHEIRKIDAALNLTEAEDRVRFLAAGSNETFASNGSLAEDERRREQIPVRAGLTELVVGFEGQPGRLDGNRWRLRIEAPDGRSASYRVPADGSFSRTIVWNGSAIPDDPRGDWGLEVELVSSRNVTERQAWRLDVRAEYAIDSVQHKTARDDPAIGTIAPRGHLLVDWPVVATSRGNYTAKLEVRAELYHNHLPQESDTDAVFVEDELTASAVVGDTYRPPEPLTVASTGGQDRTAFMRSWGKVTGFASLLLLGPTMILVGIAGHHHKYAMNRFFGDARNRVVWHAAVSWIIILLAAVHSLLFLMEPQFDELAIQGLQWTTGWVALAAMVGLGVTGLWQIPLTKTIGYRSWRWTHLGLAVAALVLTVVHTVWDGTDFAWLWS